MSDAFIVCEEHGDIYVHRGARIGDVRDASKVELLDPRLQRPATGDVIRCFCGRTLGLAGGLREEVRK